MHLIGLSEYFPIIPIIFFHRAKCKLDRPFDPKMMLLRGIQFEFGIVNAEFGRLKKQRA